MKGKKISMTNLRQVLQRLRENQSIRSIASEMRLHRRNVRKLKDLSIEKAWLNPDTPMPTDEELMNVWEKDDEVLQEHVLDPCKEKIEEWHNDKHTAVVIHRLLKEVVSVPVDVDV